MTSTNRIRVAATLFWLGVSLANSARAVDLRDWGRKYDNASERFVVLSQFNNDAVLDKETQLVWRRSAMTAVSWVSALNNCYASGTGARYGWRLPSFSELLSLVGTGAVLPDGHPFLNVANNAYFWSSTDHPTDPDLARAKILAGYNYISSKSKDESWPYLCVRGVGVTGR